MTISTIVAIITVIVVRWLFHHVIALILLHGCITILSHHHCHINRAFFLINITTGNSYCFCNYHQCCWCPCCYGLYLGSTFLTLVLFLPLSSLVKLFIQETINFGQANIYRQPKSSGLKQPSSTVADMVSTHSQTRPNTDHPKSSWNTMPLIDSACGYIWPWLKRSAGPSLHHDIYWFVWVVRCQHRPLSLKGCSGLRLLIQLRGLFRFQDFFLLLPFRKGLFLPLRGIWHSENMIHSTPVNSCNTRSMSQYDLSNDRTCTTERGQSWAFLKRE